MTIPGQPQYGAPQQFTQPTYPPPQQYAPAPAAPTQLQQPSAYGQPGAPAPQPGQFFTQQNPHVQAQQPPAPPQYQPAPAMSAQPIDTSSFFGGAATISFAAEKGYVKGTFRGGQVSGKKISPQTKMGTGEVIRWGDGSPREQMVLTLQTAERADPQDDGTRQLFIKGDGVRSCRDVLSAVQRPDIEIGGWYYQAWVDEKPAKQAGYNPQKVFKSIYAPPGSPDPLAGQHVPTPQPTATVDQFAAYANYQQTGVVPVQPNGAPAQLQQPQAQPQVPAPQPGSSPEHYAQFAAQQAATAQPGPIANAPAAAMANFAQQAQHDPAVLAAIGAPQPPPGQAFVQAAAPEIAAMPQMDPAMAAQFAAWQAQQQQQGAPQPGGQSGAGSNGIQQPPSPVAAPASVPPGEWSPFAPA